MNYKVSVIIPVYNAEKTLENTINSVINQSIGFENIELILVDDNSTDNSKELIKKFQHEYTNITSYFSNKNHRFPGFGRNKGIELSSAEYIMFLDNDDEYDKDMCKKLYETMIKYEVDLVSCGRVLIDHIGKIKDNYIPSSENYQKDYLIYENKNILSYDSVTVWNKIFKKENITKFNLKFLEDSSSDDFVFSIEYNIYSQRILHLTDYYGYHWNLHDTSLSHTINIEHFEEVFNAYTYLVNKLKLENKLNDSEVILNHMIALLISKCIDLKTNLKNFKKILNDIYTFEIESNYNSELAENFLNIPNKLILKKHFNLAILYFRSIHFLKKFTFLRKINRKKGQ